MLLLAGLFLASLALRPQLVGVGPLLSTIRHGLGVSHAVAGLLSTLIVLCMGLFAPVAFTISRRIGPRRAITGALAIIAGFGVARAVAGPAAAVIALTVPVGIGVALAGSLMPLVVRQSWPQRPVLATAVYATGISLGAALSAALAVPLSDALGGWRGALTAFSLFTAALALVWLLLTRRYTDRYDTAGPLPRLPLRSGSGWLLVAIFAFTSISYYGINAWLPSSFTERGWSHASAGELLTVLNAVTVPVSIALALRGDHFGSRRFWIAAGTALQLGALLGVILAPAGGWLWATMIGAAIGLLFPSIMTMPLDVADRPADVGAMAALMLGAGYSVSAVAPFLLGLLRDAAGSFTVGMWVIFADTALMLVVVLMTSNDRLRRRPSRVRAAERLPGAAPALTRAPGPSGPASG